MEQEELNGPHGEIVNSLLSLASQIDESDGLHIEYPAVPEEGESGQILCDADAEWILNAIEAISLALVDDPPRFLDKSSQQWAERLYDLCFMIADGEDMVIDIAENIIDELSPHFADDEDED